MPWYDTQNKIQTIVPGVQSTVFPGAPKGWLVPGDPGLPGGGPIPSTLAPTTWQQLRARASALPGRRTPPTASWARYWAGPERPASAPPPGIYYTAIQDAGLFIEVADAPYGLFWVSISPPFCSTSHSSPARTAVHKSSGSRSCCRYRVRPASRMWIGPCSCRSPVRPDTSRATNCPYGEHFNFSIQRELSSNTVLTLAYVGTEGHKLFAQYEANPGNAALCLSLRGSGVKAGIAPMRTQPGEHDIYQARRHASLRDPRSRWDTEFFGSNTYESTNANSLVQLAAGYGGTARAEYDVPGGLYTSASRWTPPPASTR